MSSDTLRKPKLRAVVLNVGVSREHLLRREEILTDAGFEVINTGAEQALKLSRRRDVRLVIFGHLIPASERLKLSQALKQRYPNVRLVVMYHRSVNKTESADAVLQINVPPDDLVHTVEYLLSGRNSASARA